jgi:methionine-rich copper-binding protein CopC
VLPLRDDQGRAERIDAGLKTQGRTAENVTISLKPGLKPGAYVVMWRVLSVDTHTTSGFFVFVYQP